MHYRRLTELGIEEGLIVPGGPTPEASLNSAVTQDIKQKEAAGEAQRLRTHRARLFLAGRRATRCTGAVDRKNEEVRVRLREVLGDMHPQAFERLIGELLVALGFDGVEVTRYVGDKGIDLRATLVVGGVTDVKTAIQVKRHTTGSIGAPTVRELRGGLGPHRPRVDHHTVDVLQGCPPGSVGTGSQPDLTGGRHRVIELLIDSRVGVSSTNVTILELDEGFFTEGADDDTSEQLVAGDTPTPVRRVRSLTQPGKVLSLWPLPGGGGAWKDTLDAMLKHIAAEAPTMADAISWLTSSFDRVASQKTSRGYWQVLRSFVSHRDPGEQVSVTAVGSDTSGPDEHRLLEIAKTRWSASKRCSAG